MRALWAGVSLDCPELQQLFSQGYRIVYRRDSDGKIYLDLWKD